MIANIHKNRMGTTSFTGKLGKMRKEQSFVVYPIHSDMNGETITIQSENRFAIVKVADGKTIMTSNYVNANSMRLQLDLINGKAEAFIIPQADLEPLLAFIRGTAGAMVGNNCMAMYTDNSNANLVGV